MSGSLRHRATASDGFQRRYPFILGSWILILGGAAASSTAGMNSGLIDAVFMTGETPPSVTRHQTVRSLQTVFFDHGDPTVYEQLMLECINRARADPAAEAARLGIGLNDGLAPGTITNEPKPPLASHPLLLAAARGHAQWMLDTDTFSHTGIDGTSPGDRMANAGYVFSGSWNWGENLSWGGTLGLPDVEQYTLARHDSLFRSAGHRVNICSTAFNEIGVAVRTGPFTSGGTTYNSVMVAQNFARSGATPGPLVLGVIYRDANGNGRYDPGEGIAGVSIRIEDGDWHTLSASAGGYALPYSGASGTLRLILSGPMMPGTLTFSLARTGQNIKQDLDLNLWHPMQFNPGSLSQSALTGFQALVQGPAGTPFDLQHSLDFSVWTTVSQHVFGAGPIEITHQPPTAANAHYYRLQR